MSSVPTYLDELFGLSGRTAVVTGGSSGIGRATVSYTHLTLPTNREV